MFRPRTRASTTTRTRKPTCSWAKPWAVGCWNCTEPSDPGKHPQPSGQQARDTVNLILAEPDGLWLGSGTGKHRELRLLYREKIRFSEPGTYTFTLEQAMRTSKLPVSEAGIRIERINP